MDTRTCSDDPGDHSWAEEMKQILAEYHAAAAGLDGVLKLTIIDLQCGTARPQAFRIGDVVTMAAEAFARSRHANVYVACSVLRKEVARNARGKRGDIVAVLGLVIDDDRDTGKRATLPSGIEPTFELTTCTEPAVNRHLHFVFNRPVPPDEAEGLAELLYRKCGGDHGTKDIAHIWRLPDTLNHPTAVKLKRGRPARPQPVQLTGGSFERVDPKEMRRALEAMPDLHPPRVRTGNGHAGAYTGGSTDPAEIMARLPSEIIDLVETEIPEGEGDRSLHCFSTMTSLMDHGLTDDEVRVLAPG
jgi:hypothetical protein